MKRRYTIVLELDDLDGPAAAEGPMVPYWQVDDEIGPIAERGFSRHLAGLFLTLDALLREDFEGGSAQVRGAACEGSFATSRPPAWRCILQAGHEGKHVYGSIAPPNLYHLLRPSEEGGGS